MYTKEMLAKSNNPKKDLIGFLSYEQAKELVIKSNMLKIINNKDKQVYFFTDDHAFGQGVLPKGYMVSTVYFPVRIVTRPSLPTGIIDNIDTYIDIFKEDGKLIGSIEELVEFLNSEE